MAYNSLKLTLYCANYVYFLLFLNKKKMCLTCYTFLKGKKDQFCMKFMHFQKKKKTLIFAWNILKQFIFKSRQKFIFIVIIALSSFTYFALSMNWKLWFYWKEVGSSVNTSSAALSIPLSFVILFTSLKCFHFFFLFNRI